MTLCLLLFDKIGCICLFFVFFFYNKLKSLLWAGVKLQREFYRNVFTYVFATEFKLLIIGSMY